MDGFRFEGKTALVTGASRGIGKAIARRLAHQGARTVIAARSVESLEELAAELTGIGAETQILRIDLSETGKIETLIEQLPEVFRDIDILVNNAGITADNVFARMKLKQWEDVVQVNLTGAYAVTRALCRGMMRRRWGRIISISSVVGLMGNPGQANYAAAKAGLIGFSKALARELAGRNITVNVVAPGFIDTAMTEAIPEKSRERLLAAIPLGRLGKVEDVAAAVSYLASEEAGYITGHVLNVSGGLYI